MSEQPKTYTYKVEDIFEDIPNDPNNVIMNLPQEVMDEVGIVPGDTVKILLGDQGSLIIQKVDKETNEQETEEN